MNHYVIIFILNFKLLFCSGPGDVVLATASVDNNIIIWNMERLPEQVTILKGHTSLVKGVFFDPVGKYLASQSDDKTLRIWKTSDWSQEVVIGEPFRESGATTHVLRPGWSIEQFGNKGLILEQNLNYPQLPTNSVNHSQFH